MSWRSGIVLYILGASLALSSQIACADPTTLICDVKVPDNSCCVYDEPGTIVLDEAAKKVTIHYPPGRTRTTGARAGIGDVTVTSTASFGPDAIVFEVYGQTLTLSRLTGVVAISEATTWTCHVGKAQF